MSYCFYRFLYTETIPITPDNVLRLLHAGKRYMVQSLIDKCLQRLNAKMKQGNLCLIMEASHIFGEPDLREKCRKDIIQNPKQVLPSETLAELCTECLESVIQDDDLRMEEEEIFEYMVKYSENKCLKEDLPVTPENQRKVLGKAIQQIRFTLMDKNYFSDVVEPSGLLKHDESVAVLKYFLNPQSVPVPFSASHRNLHKIVKRFQTHYSGWTYNYRHNADAITCKCSEDIQILGVLTYGSSDRPKEFDAKISIKTAMNATKVMQVFKVKSNGSTKIYDCIFNRPVQIPKEEKFTIVLEMKPGKTTYFGEDGQEKVESEEVTFTFMHSTCSLNNTTCARGQIPGIIYCLDRP